MADIASQAKALVEAWGFNPEVDEYLCQFALRSCEIRNDKTGKVVVALGLASSEEVEQLLADKPQNVLTLEWLAERLHGVRSEIQKLLAFIHAHPYFEELDPSFIHPLMGKEPAIKKKCDELSAVLMKTPSGKPLMVFSDYATLSGWSQEGRIDRLGDPIRVHAGNAVVGLADASVIIRTARLNTAEDRTRRVLATGSVDNIWFSAHAKTDGERVLARILDGAISVKATDVEIAPNRDGTSSVRIRVFGDMRDSEWYESLDIENTKEITRFLISKSRAGDGGRLRQAADGQMTYKTGQAEVFMRCSFIPADRAGLDYDMISTSLRLLPRMAKPIYLEELNITELVKSEILKALYRSQGLIVVAGPTNSGKSTTIAGVVGEHIRLFGNSKKRLSLEDPVERYLEGITQITVDDNFADLIRHVLRHDPDMVWVGEIRDGYSATSCVRAATSGHVVLSTVHANDSILAFRAISNYLQKQATSAEGAGATVFDLAESVSLIIGQRLIKRLCPHCKVSHLPDSTELDLLKEYMVREGHGEKLEQVFTSLKSGNVHKVGAGCLECGKAGYIGELPVQEILPVSREVKEVLGMQENGINYREVAKFRLNTLFDDVLLRVLAGESEVGALFI